MPPESPPASSPGAAASHDAIRVVGAREHNLKGVDVELPRDALTVITGLSGSGKSSLAFDTVYQEGQRRFMESLSAYARQFLGQMEKPRVERVDGLSPTLCIDQKTVNRNPRSTVGTITEILDHLRLLMARLGTPHCPKCDREIATLSPGQIADAVLRDAPGARLHVLGPIVQDRKGEYRKELRDALADGYLRARIDGELRQLDDGADDIQLARYEKHTIELVVDRLRARPDQRARLLEAVSHGLRLGNGVVTVLIDHDDGDAKSTQEHRAFSSQRSCPDHPRVSIPEMEPRLFSFNAPQGACGGCNGIGWLEDFDLDLLLDPQAPYDHAFKPLPPDDSRLPFSSLSRPLVRHVAESLGVTGTPPWSELTDHQAEALLFGPPEDEPDLRFTITHSREADDGSTRTSTRTQSWRGLLPMVQHCWKFSQLKRLKAFRRRIPCPRCQGRRLNDIALGVRFEGRNISELSTMSIVASVAFFEGIQLREEDRSIGDPILRELRSRLAFLDKVGLGYLSIDRSAATLSGGEAQRIRLASQVGAGLQGVTYVLDEPSIGLHPRDQGRLLDALEELRDKGNTILVVEHDAMTMARADQLLEIGPGAGREGGEVVASGSPRAFLKSQALTARYLRGEERIPVPVVRRPGTGELWVKGARAHNLTGVDACFRLGALNVVTGVSGSGKSSLVLETLTNAARAALHGAEDLPGPHDAIEGLEHIDKVVFIDQNPIGRTPRSNPATYTNAFDPIRQLFAQLPEARARGWTASRFSFNVAPDKGGGRCEECEGAGVKTIEMQFLSDVEVPCEACGGKRFNAETLELRYRGRTIADVLDTSVAEAARFFRNHRKIHGVLATMEQVGLAYVHLGQPSTTLSGGEAQRIKLASELHKRSTGRTLYVLDEPTTGLHMADVHRLLQALDALVQAGNTVVVIEHDVDVIKSADWIVDLGPEGGNGGGKLTGMGTPEQLAGGDLPTGRLLAEVLEREARADAGGTLAAEGGGVYDFRPPRARRRTQGGGGHTIELHGVRTHNLRGVDLRLPHGKLTVITGPSGSGKTSLAFDTLFAEGQRRYVEALSTYARRFLGRMDKPPLEKAEGLAPAIAIDQQASSHNPRSTVATVTELYDSLRLLYARVGHAHCPRCAHPVRAWSPSAVARDLQAAVDDAGWLLAPLPPGTRAGDLRAEGFTRWWDAARVGGGQPAAPEHAAEGAPTEPLDGTVDAAKRRTAERQLDELEPDAAVPGWLVIDRLRPSGADRQRLAEGVALAYGWGGERCVFVPRDGAARIYSRAASCPTHGRVLPEELQPRSFSFNSHVGACPTCDGLGRITTVDPELLLEKPDKPLLDAIDGRIKAGMFRSTRNRTLAKAVFKRFGTKWTDPVEAWGKGLRRAMLYGLDEDLEIKFTRKWGSSSTRIEETRRWPGMIPIIDGWDAKVSWLTREAPCHVCEGGRVRRPHLFVTIGSGDHPGGVPTADDGATPPGVSISGATAMTVAEAHAFWSELGLQGAEALIADQAITELLARLRFLDDVGLGYLTLDRAAHTLSGGEAQRIRLATQLGARLTGTIYVLDEPTIGLHPRDTERLLGTLRGLRDLGNTLVVVEHDPDVMWAADHLVDMGPAAGEHGGRIMAQGSPADVAAGGATATAAFLSGQRSIPVPATRRVAEHWLEPPAFTRNNLRDVTFRVPRGCLTVVTGVSGSGKSSLVLDSFAPWLEGELDTAAKRKRASVPDRLIVVDQRPISRSPRSCPATYADLFDPIRKLYADTPLAREQGWKAGMFSYNAKQGRCPHCEGRGAVLVEMHFLSDVWVPCEHCGGRRFQEQVLEAKWKGLSIADVLDLPAQDALDLFRNQRTLKRRIQALVDVGLGYLRLGQPVNTLSGGESQRLKLSKELAAPPRKHRGRGPVKETVFLLDEPTTGLHFTDVEKLLVVLQRLVDQGHTVVLIEHHLDVIRAADLVVDLGPEGGTEGGRIVAQGTPEALRDGWQQTGSWTGRALAGSSRG
ncbi:MAG: excinuclease ABC subunit UvrA [Alphaproteobacteria bacterium]|nr:excinuclease ABC subunit UvrA [Alphaproteobacteria bacterium]